MLAKLAGYGRDVDAWMIVKKEALRKFVVCDDGRLYHPVIAEKANDAWEKKKAFKARTEAARAARLQKLSQSDDKKPTDDVTISVTENIGQSVTGSKGEGEGQGTGEKRKIDAPEGSGGEKQKRKSRISPEAQPGPADLEHAATAGVSPRIEWPKFRDHHIAKGSLMADWSAAWRTWCANAKQFGRAAPNSMPALSLAPPPTEITPDRWREALRDYCARSGSGWHQGVFGPDPEMSNCRCPEFCGSFPTLGASSSCQSEHENDLRELPHENRNALEDRSAAPTGRGENAQPDRGGNAPQAERDQTHAERERRIGRAAGAPSTAGSRAVSAQGRGRQGATRDGYAKREGGESAGRKEIQGRRLGAGANARRRHN
jgi:hypothetical protein